MTAPMLLFYSGRTQYWNFYDIINKKVLDFQVNVPKKGLVGSSKGWLVFVKRNVVDIKLLEATISADPILNASDCIVTVIHLERYTLAFIRLGKDTTWTYVDESVDDSLEGCCMIEDVANVGNKLYAVNYWSELLSFDVTTWSNSNMRSKLPKTYTKRAKKLLKMSYPLPIWVMPTVSFPL
ncbi:hypothetical protein M0R45_001518 [Rubus argutus]|uniref:KIB1-4 beta-propeller domain-containing protein n=1 Tax=Rubus argutus TaxID=59490 RepID=A0AAW1VLI7_RUBAR